MVVPEELKKVSPLKKGLALFVLIASSLIGFAFGVRYQEIIDLQKKQLDNLSLTSERKQISPPPLSPSVSKQISQEEKQKIDRWIITNNRNLYGDPKDTVYLGGTPLFNEATGQSLDKYEYIITKYPDKPWNK